MLREILVRDWILNRTAVLVSFGIFSAFEVYAVLSMDGPREWLVFASIFCAFLALTMFTREDKFQATAWACTLPITRTDLVLARFVGAWVLVVAGLGSAMLIAVVVPGSRIDPVAGLDLTTVLIASAVVTGIVAVMLPFTVRFGMLGVMIFLVGAQMMGVLALSLGKFIQRQGGGTGRPIKDGLAQVGVALAEIREALTPDGFTVLVVAVLVLVNWLGYQASVFLFRRREF
jgi:hypothetical protein